MNQLPFLTIIFFALIAPGLVWVTFAYDNLMNRVGLGGVRDDERDLSFLLWSVIALPVTALLVFAQAKGIATTHGQSVVLIVALAINGGMSVVWLYILSVFFTKGLGV